MCVLCCVIENLFVFVQWFNYTDFLKAKTRKSLVMPKTKTIFIVILNVILTTQAVLSTSNNFLQHDNSNINNKKIDTDLKSDQDEKSKQEEKSPSCVNGKLSNNFCLCDAPYTGRHCDILVRQEVTKTCPIHFDCSDNGKCINDKCWCKHPYTGFDCRSLITSNDNIIENSSYQKIIHSTLALLQKEDNGIIWIYMLLFFGVCCVIVILQDIVKRLQKVTINDWIEKNIPQPLAARILAILPVRVKTKPGEFCVKVFIKEIRGHTNGDCFGLSNVKAGEIAISVGDQYWSHKTGRYLNTI